MSKEDDSLKVVASNLTVAYYACIVNRDDAGTGLLMPPVSADDTIEAVYEIYQRFLRKLGGEKTSFVGVPPVVP